MHYTTSHLQTFVDQSATAGFQYAYVSDRINKPISRLNLFHDQVMKKATIRSLDDLMTVIIQLQNICIAYYCNLISQINRKLLCSLYHL